MGRSLIRVFMHFRRLLWRKCPKRIPRVGGDSPTSSKVLRCEKTLRRGKSIVHQWTPEAKALDEGSGARLALNLGARHGVNGASKWSRPLPAGQSPAASFDSKSSRVAGGKGQPP